MLRMPAHIPLGYYIFFDAIGRKNSKLFTLDDTDAAKHTYENGNG